MCRGHNDFFTCDIRDVSRALQVGHTDPQQRASRMDPDIAPGSNSDQHQPTCGTLSHKQDLSSQK